MSKIAYTTISWKLGSFRVLRRRERAAGMNFFRHFAQKIFSLFCTKIFFYFVYFVQKLFSSFCTKGKTAIAGGLSDYFS